MAFKKPVLAKIALYVNLSSYEALLFPVYTVYASPRAISLGLNFERVEFKLGGSPNVVCLTL